MIQQSCECMDACACACAYALCGMSYMCDTICSYRADWGGERDVREKGRAPEQANRTEQNRTCEQTIRRTCPPRRREEYEEKERASVTTYSNGNGKPCIVRPGYRSAASLSFVPRPISPNRFGSLPFFLSRSILCKC